MHPSIFLFDIDGVLVQPLGYRAAVRATINYFTRQMGLPELAPDDQTVAIFEAQGITCEWDMIPITLAIILDAALANWNEPVALENFQAACRLVRSRKLDGLTIDFAPILRGLGKYTRPGEAPAESLLALCESGQGESLFPALSGQGVLRELFSYTRRPAVSRTTAVFETYALGHQVFSEAMGLPFEIESEAFLAKYDSPLLLPDTRAHLLDAADQNRVRMAAYTARPSRPLTPSAEPLAVYTPEAEMALNLVGLQSIPLIGSGQVGQAARQLDELEDRLTKPSPYHALAAIFAAHTGDRRAALDWMESMYCFAERNASRPPLDIVAGIRQVHIFEDSPSGLRGVKDAVHLLNELGLPIQLTLWGISQHPEKLAALRSVGASVYPDINLAVNEAFKTNLFV